MRRGWEPAEPRRDEPPEFQPGRRFDDTAGAGYARINQVLLQAPGVAQDSFGQVHVRGDHANVQFRINGVELPEGLSVFGQALATRFARSISLITGALPAQYGFQTAGVLDIQTKTGVSNPGLALTAYGGTFSWAQPSFEYGGRYDNVDCISAATICRTRAASKIPPRPSMRCMTTRSSGTASPS